MTIENQEKLKEWFEKYDTMESDIDTSFENCKNKYSRNKQVSGLVFISSKLKDIKDDLIHGEHDTIFIGSSFDSFNNFSEDDVITCVCHGIFIEENGDGFQMHASL